MFACLHSSDLPDAGGALLLECAYGFSPRIEQTAETTVALDLQGLERLLGPPEQIARALARRAAELSLEVRVAVASNPDAAIHAARGFPGVTVIQPGEEARALAGLPVEVLKPSPELAETLALWGIRRLGDLARLPEAGVAARLGPEGSRLQQMARGAGCRRLLLADPAPVFEESLELEHPLESVEPLLFLLGPLIEQLCLRLQARGRATQELRLTLRLADRTEHARVLRLPLPSRNHRAFLKLLHLDLDEHPPRAAVAAIYLQAEPAAPRCVQQGLFLPLAPEPEKLQVTLARIQHLVGDGRAGAPELLDTHRPGAFHVKRFAPPAPGLVRAVQVVHPTLTLRIFRPALRARVEAPAGAPGRIEAPGVSGRVVARAGPWRTAGEWWRTAPWSRDEWDVTLANAAMYRIYHDPLERGWFLAGEYD